MEHDVAVPERATAGAVLLHPHPDLGGDRHNVVVSALYRALPGAGVAALRFDFGSSDPEQAAAETVTALDGLAAAHDPRPKHIAVPEHDQFSPPGRARDLTVGWESTSVETIPGGDHFLVGRTSHVVDACRRFLASSVAR